MLDLIFSDHFTRNEPEVSAELRDTLLTQGDHYMHLADLRPYIEAQQHVDELRAREVGLVGRARGQQQQRQH